MNVTYNTETDPIGQLLVTRDGEVDYDYADAYSEAMRAVAIDYTGRLAMKYARSYITASVRAVGLMSKYVALSAFDDLRTREVEA